RRKMVNMHHEKALKASSSKGAGSPTNDADNDGNENGSSFDSGDLNFGAKEVDKIQEEFQTLTQTNETMNELWKKFNDLIRYRPEYIGNENLKVEKFQRMLHDDIREVISLFKCTTLDNLLSRARVR
nr:zinc finger, CCHC-type, retrotransposon Gag domain protein [Tanacetum cinerariifolium]